MSDFIKRLVGTALSNVIQSTALCACLTFSDEEYFKTPDKLGYLCLFWLGAMMPLKMGQFKLNKLILRRMDLPNYNFFYLTNAKALIVDVSLNHLFFPFIGLAMLYNYFQHAVPSVYPPKAKTVAKFEEIKEEVGEKKFHAKEAAKSQELLKDLLFFRIHLSAASIFWDLVFPRFNMARQTAKVVTDLTRNGQKIQLVKTYVFGLAWNAYTVNKYFEYHH